MTKKFQLKNGLNVLLVESHKSPVVSVQMWVKTGSADEKKGEEGISHFIEHLVFKGTRNYSVGEIAATVEGSGGELNAYTSFDQTVFYVTISKEFADVGLDVISEMMGHPSFDPDEINNEREVVIEEIKRGKDSPGRRASQLMFSTVYKKHPYGIPVIGYEEVIKKVTPKKLVEYFHSRYVPRNMFLVIAGDFEVTEMKKKVNQYFSDFTDFKVKKIARAKESKQTKTRIAIEKVDFREAKLYFSWPIPKITHKDIPGLDILALILGQGDSSRLVHKLRIEENIVNSVGSSAFTPEDPGVFAVSMALEKKNIKLASEHALNEILRLKKEGPTQEEFAKALTLLEADQLMSLETVDGLARKAGSYQFSFGDPEYYKKYIKQLQKVKPSDIQKLIKKYLLAENVSVTGIVDGSEKAIQKELDSVLKNYKKISKTTPTKKPTMKGKVKREKIEWSLPKKATSPETEKIVLSNGTTLLLRPFKDSPTFSLRTAHLGGSRAETIEHLGASEMLSRVWVSQTKKYSEAELYHEIDRLAFSLSAFAGKNTIGMTLDALGSLEKKVYPFFEEAFLRHDFTSDIVEREKQVFLQQIQNQVDNPGQICGKHFARMMFGDHPYGRDYVTNQARVAALTKTHVDEVLAKTVSAKNTVICLSGNFSVDFWLKKLEYIDSTLKSGSRFDKALPMSSASAQTHFEKNAKEQTHIMFGYKGCKLSDEDRHALQVIQSILAGQGGRLFIELRDKNSLAYSVAPMKMEGIEAGYFGAYIACSPEKAEKAIAMMRAEFKKLTTELVATDELLRAQRYLLGRHDIDLQRASAVTSSIIFDHVYGIDFNQTFTIRDKYMNLSRENIKDVAQKYFGGPETISVVGQIDPLS